MRRRRCCWYANRKGAAPEGLALAGQAAGAKAPSFSGEPWVPLAQTGLQRCCPGQRVHLGQTDRMPSESEPIEAKPSFFGPTKQTPAAQKPTREGSEAAPGIGLDPHGSGPGACLARRQRRLYPRRALGLGPGQAPRPSSARALAWFSVPGNPANRSGDPPWDATKAPKPDRQPGQSRETTAKAPPDPWEPVGLAVPGWRAAAKGPAGPSHQAAWVSGQTNPPGEPQLWRLLVWM